MAGRRDRGLPNGRARSDEGMIHVLNEQVTVGSRPAVDVLLGLGGALRPELERLLALAGGVRLLASCGSADQAIRQAARITGLRKPVVLLALDELGPMELSALADTDVAVLLVVRDVGGVDLGRVSSVSSVGIVDGDALTARSLFGALEQIAAGQVPIPARLAQRLLASGGAAGVKPIPRLTSREQEVLVLLVDGLSNKQIARRLAISDHGAKRLVGNILAKLDAPNRTLAVTRSLRDGLYEHCLNGRGLRHSA